MTTEEELRVLEKVPIKECGEPLVNIHDYNKEIIIDLEETSKKAQELGENTCFVRKSVAEKLDKVQKLLKVKNLRLKIVDAYRPLSAQQESWNQVYDSIKKKNPSLSDKEIVKEVSKWVAHPNTIPPHSTGGTVDLTIVNGTGKELDMGSPINTAGNKSITNAQDISEEGKRNRQILIEVMSSQDFVNYVNEWWHWSYGDRRWGAAKGKPSIYNSL